MKLKFFIPFRNIGNYAPEFIAGLVPVIIGRSFDERILGYTYPDWALA